jgi:hypothetical protein
MGEREMLGVFVENTAMAQIQRNPFPLEENNCIDDLYGSSNTGEAVGSLTKSPFTSKIPILFLTVTIL